MDADLRIRQGVTPSPGDMYATGNGAVVFVIECLERNTDECWGPDRAHYNAFLIPKFGEPVGPSEVCHKGTVDVIGRMDPHDWTAAFARLARLEWECQQQRRGLAVMA